MITVQSRQRSKPHWRQYEATVIELGERVSFFLMYPLVEKW